MEHCADLEVARQCMKNCNSKGIRHTTSFKWNELENPMLLPRLDF